MAQFSVVLYQNPRHVSRVFTKIAACCNFPFDTRCGAGVFRQSENPQGNALRIFYKDDGGAAIHAAA
ncbi:MAG: hypothetical protein ACLTWR_09385 [Agathobaculum desmolans]